MSEGGSSLRFHLTTVFIVLIAAIVGTIAYYTYFKNTDAVLELADKFIAQTSEATIQRTQDHLAPLASAVQNLAALADSAPELTRSADVFPTLMSILDTYPQLQSVYFGYKENGRFLQAIQLPPGTKVYGRPNYSQLPPGTHYALRVLDYGGDKIRDHWEYFKKDGTKVFEEDAFRMFYDVRQRGWFKTVLKRPHTPYWTNVVVFTSSQLPGIAPAYPIHDKSGKTIGAAAGNVTLAALSKFLQELDIGKSGVAFIMDEKHRLVAHPDLKRTVKKIKDKTIPAPAVEMEEVWVTDAVKRFVETKEQKFRVTVKGEEYLASFTPFPEDFGKPWVMAVVVPVGDFVGSLRTTNRSILVIAVMITIFGALLVGGFAGWITKPIRQLVEEIGKIREFDLSGDINIRSGTTEIMALANSIRTMKTALQTFGKFVPKTLVREMVSSGIDVELGGQSRHLTIMFTDIAGFSTIAERSPTRELMLALSDHFECITEAISFNQGTIDKFIGDSVMAFWGAPVWHEDHVYQGCLSALMAKSNLDLLNESWKEDGKPQYYVRFGIHTDAVLVGNIGAKDRLSYTVIGDGVNVAARLEGVNKVYGTQIITSHSVYQEAGERCLFRPLDMVAVQGRRAGIIIYELIGTIHNGHPDFQATEAQIRLCEIATRGFYAYLERQWDEAIQCYTDILAMDPNDRVATMFLHRCQEYRANPPTENWSGVSTMKSK